MKRNVLRRGFGPRCSPWWGPGVGGCGGQGPAPRPPGSGLPTPAPGQPGAAAGGAGGACLRGRFFLPAGGGPQPVAGLPGPGGGEPRPDRVGVHPGHWGGLPRAVHPPGPGVLPAPGLLRGVRGQRQHLRRGRLDPPAGPTPSCTATTWTTGPCSPPCWTTRRRTSPGSTARCGFDTLEEEGEYQVVAAFYSQAYDSQEEGAFRYYQYTDLSDPQVFSEYVRQAKAALPVRHGRHPPSPVTSC